MTIPDTAYDYDAPVALAHHMWVHAWCPAQRCFALDPIDAGPAGTDHFTLAWGRDYADVAPLRGVIR